MTNITARISAAATLLLAALPAAALPASAFAATTVKVADINLLTDEGMATFKQRADYAARNYCSGVMSLHARATCREGVKVELDEKVAVIRAAELERTSSALAAR